MRAPDNKLLKSLEPQSASATDRLVACSRLAHLEPEKCAIFLDVDGTLLDLATTPSSITVPDNLVQLLGDLSHSLGGALAIITGRRIAEIDRILAPLQLAASGVHGSEMRMTPGGETLEMMPALPDQIVEPLIALAARTPGAFAEPKGAGLAIHYRLAPDAGPAIASALADFVDSRKDQLEIWPGHKVFEVIPAGLTKGTALESLAASAPFKDRIPIMIGDDIGDEPAFAAAERLNGFGLRVASENFREHATEFSGPASVRDWLARVAAAARHG